MEYANNTQELKAVISEAVDKSVKASFKKYAKKARVRSVIVSLIVLLIICALTLTGMYIYRKKSSAALLPAPVEDHDLVMENNGIFGFKVADFQEAILGRSTRERLLIVENQEVSVPTSISATGLFKLAAFTKQQALIIHGTGEYTIDLKEISADDISLDDSTYELTVRIPHAKLNNVSYDPEKTEIQDVKKGWLAVGKIKLDQEEQKEFLKTAIDKLEEKLEEKAYLDQADRFAKLSAFEIYQPVVKAISPAYSVIIEFQ